MLTITVPGLETFNNDTQMFSKSEDVVLQLEHSLVSLSKWESTWNKPFLGKEEKTTEQVIDYIRLMTLNPVDDLLVYARLSAENYKAINEYINAKQTATWFRENPNQRPNREIITAEIIYFWMVTYNIPREYEEWHLNRLFTLVKVINQKNQPAKKGGAPSAAQRSALNAQRLGQASR